MLTFGTSAGTAAHAVTTKLDPRGAAAWSILALVVPFAGALLYLLFGVNRVPRAAQRYATRTRPDDATATAPADAGAGPVLPASFALLDRSSRAVTNLPLCGANSIRLYTQGEETFAAMAAAIDDATTLVRLSTYIFDPGCDVVIDALEQARRRGVDVRVLVDGFGKHYHRPSALSALRDRGVPCAVYLPMRIVPPSLHINLRNHRKLLIVDGDCVFVGGMNINRAHVAQNGESARHGDIHFRFNGPIAAQCRDVFETDWAFANNSRRPPPSPPAASQGSAYCRTIVDGPDSDIDKLALVLRGAFGAAQTSIRILTPYFVPNRELVAVLQSAALRGVNVQIALPRTNNMPFIRWASHHLVGELTARGVEVFEVVGPFHHGKLFVVDEHYVQVGSANLDERSLRLNFEVMVEVYDDSFGTQMADWFDAHVAATPSLTTQALATRGPLTRLRDGFAAMFGPFL